MEILGFPPLMNAPRRCSRKSCSRVVDQLFEPTLGSCQVEYELLPTDLESSSRWAVAKVLPNGGAGLFFVGPKKSNWKVRSGKMLEFTGTFWETACFPRPIRAIHGEGLLAFRVLMAPSMAWAERVCGRSFDVTWYLSNEKKGPGLRIYIGDYILPRYKGIFFINHLRIPIEELDTQ